MAEQWHTDDLDDLARAFMACADADELTRFLRDLCTLHELQTLVHRWQCVRLLDAGTPYARVAAEVGASTATVTRVAHWLRHGEGGYRAVLDRVKDGS